METPGPAKKIWTRREFTKNTGYEDDLYRIEGLTGDAAQQVETYFMSLVDGGANQALRMLNAGQLHNWSIKQKSTWARFILSLIIRNPETVSLLRNHMATMVQDGLSIHEASYARVRDVTSPPTFAEFFEQRNGPVKASELSALRLLQQSIDNERIAPLILRMKWFSVELSKSPFPLLVSDRPVERPRGLGNPNSYVSLPIGPRRLFVATNDEHWAKQLLRTDHTEIVKRVNEFAVQRAHKMVWGVDYSARKLVENRFGKSPEPPILSDDQKERARDTVRRNFEK